MAAANDPTPRTEPEVETVAALQRGDVEAFRCLVSELTPGLTRLATAHVPPALADEVVQDTWAAVVQSIGTFEGRSSLQTWVYRILLNKVRTLAHREARIVPFASVGQRCETDDRSTAEADWLVDPDHGQGYWLQTPDRWESLPLERLEGLEVIDVINRAISGLPSSQREVIELRDVQGWSPDEVCGILEISSVNQRVLLHRGRVAVRISLQEYLSP